MSETTIAAPLSGEEILDVVRGRIDQEVVKALRRDCHLNPALAYEGFDGDIAIDLNLRDNGRIAVVTVRLHIEDRPPNVVRETAGLPIPTLVEDSSGKREVRGVKYAGKSVPEPPVEKPAEEMPPSRPLEEPNPKEPKPADRTRVVR